MAIDKIYIPTVHRVDEQTTYNNLPDSLKKKVVLVVQAWERPQYKYDCEYLVLPDTEEYHYSHYFCFSKTKKLIYEVAKNTKYCIFDDDIIFYRRNGKYFGLDDNMEKSKRIATTKDILQMFELYENWLDLPEVTVCGCAHSENPPAKAIFTKNSSISSVFWINGNDFADRLNDFDLDSVRVAQDVCFLLSLLTNGYGNRVGQEFVFLNMSNKKKNMKSTQWDLQTKDLAFEDHKKISNMFPQFFNILFNPDGTRVSGGYRGVGKVKIKWSEAYKHGRSKLKGNSFDKMIFDEFKTYDNKS